MQRNVAGLIFSLVSLSALAAPGEGTPNPIRMAHAKAEITRLSSDGEQVLLTRELDLPVVDEALPGAQARPASLTVPTQLSSGEIVTIELDVEARLATVQRQAAERPNTTHGYRLFHSPLEFAEAFNFFANTGARRMKVLSATISLNNARGQALQRGSNRTELDLATRTAFLPVSSVALANLGDSELEETFLGGIYLLD